MVLTKTKNPRHQQILLKSFIFFIILKLINYIKEQKRLSTCPNPIRSNIPSTTTCPSDRSTRRTTQTRQVANGTVWIWPQICWLKKLFSRSFIIMLRVRLPSFRYYHLLVFMYFCLSLRLCICLFLCVLDVCSVFMSVYMCACLFVCLSVCLSVCLFECLSVCLSVCLSFCIFVLSVLYICMSVCHFLSIFLSVYLLVCLCACLSLWL